jgi:hypothetical protein
LLQFTHQCLTSVRYEENRGLFSSFYSGLVFDAEFMQPTLGEGCAFVGRIGTVATM